MMPREKLIQSGPTALSNSELIAILLRTGTSDRNVLVLGQYILEQYNGSLYALQRETLSGLMNHRGVGEVKAITVKAALELGVRYYKERVAIKPRISEPEDVYALCFESCFEEQECVKVISLDAKNHVLGLDEITRGTVNASLIHPREVFRNPILHSAVSMIVVHNHPSGDPMPSPEDRKITEKITQCGELLSIPCRDHVILGKQCYYSFTIGKIFLKGATGNGPEPRDEKIAETERSHKDGS
jgi:DNA repair protein RadC